MDRITLTVKETAELLGISLTTIYSLVKTNEIPHTKVKGKILFHRNMVENWAQHTDYRKLKRGQLFTSIPEIMEACSWYVGYRKEKPKKEQVYQVIDWLRKSHETSYESNSKPTMITTTKVTHGLLISIENYDYYQTPKNYESNKETVYEEQEKIKLEQQLPNNINKNVKNDKQIKNYDDNKNQNNQSEQNVFKFYEQNGFGTLNPYVANKIDAWIEEFENEELIIHAMKLAIENDARKWNYIEAILRTWFNKGLKNISDVESEKLSYKASRNTGEGRKNGRNHSSYQEPTSFIPNYITRKSSLE